MKRVTTVLKNNIYYVVTICICLFIFIFVPRYTVSGSSMNPTLVNNDLIIGFSLGDIVRGDIVVLDEPVSHKLLVKRVVAMPGDTLMYTNNQLIVNGQVVNEDYLSLECLDDNTTWVDHQIKIPEGEYFVMGDNRENSRDSRMFGSVQQKNIKAKYLFKWPFHF